MRREFYFLLVLILNVFVVSPSWAQGEPCECTNCPVPITDNGTFQGFLNVEVDGVDDLGQCPLQAVCFTITHTWVGDLSVTLTSPGGLNYIVMGDSDNNFGGCGNMSDNVDICVEVGTGNPVTNNTDYICNTGPCAAGNCCLTGNWTMPCNGVTDPVSGGVLAPNCDLDDFNVPGQPANGVWTLTVNDICNQDVGFLDNWELIFSCGTLNCFNCEADGGVLNAPDVMSCFQSPVLNISAPPTYTGTPPDPTEYLYTYLISQNGIVLFVDAGPNLSNYPPGNYEVCGFSYINTSGGDVNALIGTPLGLVQANFSGDPLSAIFCGNISDDCFNVTIGPLIPPQFIVEEVCLGGCIMVGNQEVCNSGPVVFTSYLGCDSVFNVTLIPIPPVVVDLNETVCQGECITINGQEYCPPNTHQITLQQVGNGCDSIINLSFTEIEALAIIAPDPPPFLDCQNSTIVLDGTLSSPLDNITWSGPSGFFDTAPIITVTEPGDYTLTVLNTSVIPPCEDSYTVTVFESLIEPDLVVIGTPEICEGESFDLQSLVIIDNNFTGPTITFHSDTPAIPANELPTTLVNPATTTTYYILGTNGNCSDETDVTVTVNPVPNADFVVDSPICADGFSLVEYVGNASLSANFNWNFDGGNAIPGQGPGPHQVDWPAGGTYTISLTVEENGCMSGEETQTVQVDDPLPPPVISCGTITTSSVEFTWLDVPGASGYAINVLTGQVGTQSGNTFSVTGLGTGEEVQIEVIALGTGACPNSSTTFSCFTQDCPPLMILIVPVDDICLDVNTNPFNIIVNVLGGDGSGTGTWSGQGIIDPLLGTFAPPLATIGTNTIDYEFVENGCVYNASIDINVQNTPTADFTVTDPICVSDFSTITYSGTGSANATYTWNFDGGTASPGGDDPGPHEVQWTSGGTKTISLIVEENGCTSESISVTVQVDEPLPNPVINCNSTTNSIEFIWSTIDGATSYNVTVIAGMMGSMTNDTSYLVTGLVPGDQVTIEVEAVGTGACGNSTTEVTCEAQDCLPIMITIDTVADICLDATAMPFNLTATQNGGNGTGSFTWSGDGITNAIDGTFDPSVANNGGNNVVVTYNEDNCAFNESININVFEQPTALFTAESPICVEDAATVNYTGNASSGAIFNWDFDGGVANPGTGPGPHQVEWDTAGTYTVTLSVEENGCNSIMESQEVVVENTIDVPFIACTSTTTSVEFVWPQTPGAIDYNVTVINGNTGVQSSDTSYLVTGLSPGDQVTIEVEAISGGACPNTSAQLSCTAQDCTPVTIMIDPVTDICLDANVFPITLNATVVGGMGTFTWSGDGITNALTGAFDPHQAIMGDNIITVIYDENNCSYSETITITVNETPSADFTVESPICESDASLITYIGDAGIAATYNWDFGSGVASPGVGQGPHSVTWPTGGTHTISLTVAENACLSPEFSEDVQLDAPLDLPIIECAGTTTTVEFSWQNVPGATGYVVNVTNGPSGVSTSDTSYLVSNLVPNDEVTIEVTVNGTSACGSVSAEQTCIAMDCPTVVLEITPVDDICFGGFGVPIMLEVNITSPGPTGTGMWDGPGIIDPVLGIFDMVNAGFGMHTIIYNYEESACDYSESIMINVFEIPTADFTVGSPICTEELTTVTYTGNADPSASFTWNFDGGIASPGAGIGPHLVNWTDEGIKTITLEVTENGCVSEFTFEVEVEVDEAFTPPPFNCVTTTESVEFIWNNVAGADEYVITVLSGQAGDMTSDTSILFSGLVPLDEVIIEVEINGENACGSIIVQESCVASECPNIFIELTPVSPICFVGLVEQVALEIMIFGGAGNGMGTWDGPGIIDPNQDVFDPLISGVGNHTITYTYIEENCPFSESITIEVVDPPVVNFTHPGDLCEDAGIAALAATPIGGTFSGIGVVGGNFNPQIAGVGIHDLTYSFTDANSCSDSETIMVEVFALPNLDFTNPGEFCLDNPAVVLQANPTGGTFTGLGINGDQFNPGNAGVGTHTITYTYTDVNNCTNSIQEMLTVEAPPSADAGTDQLLICNAPSVTLGGAGTSTGANISYLWTADNGDFPGNPNIANPVITEPGIYTLTVTNTELNCFDTDIVEIEASIETPVPDISISPISCFGEDDGILTVTSVSGGTTPYLYSLNGSPFTQVNTFFGLAPGDYSLIVQDANGCENEVELQIFQPTELNVEVSVFIEGNLIQLGDSLQLAALITVPDDSINFVQWEPAEFLDCDTCLNPIAKPLETTTFSVTLGTEDCTDSDNITIFVRKDRPVYVPNAFSPNGDGTNDVLIVYAGSQVSRVKSFLVFNRWGETVYQYFNFQPNDPASGWDGNHRGQIMNPAVFAWFAEVEFIDGSTELYEGDVTLMR